MYTILPIHQDQAPASFFYDTLEEAVAGAKQDFNDPHTPETKGFMVVSIEKAIGINRSLDEEVTMSDFIAPAVEEEEKAVKANESA